MKKSILALGLVVLAVVALIPSVSLSKVEKNDAIVLSSDNLVVLNDEVTSDSISRVISEARALDSKSKRGTKPIYLFMNTPGGSIESGLELIEDLKGLKRQVNTITMFSASMGFQIVQNLGNRYILQSGILMSHRAQGEFEGFFGGQYPSQMDSRYGLWLQRVKELDEQTVSRTHGKQTLESYRKEYANEMWLTGSQSVQQGYADTVVLAKCDDSLNGTTSHEAEFLGLVVHYELDKCPLNTGLLNIKISAPDSKIALTTERVEEVKNKFLAKYEFNQRMALPMTF